MKLLRHFRNTEKHFPYVGTDEDLPRLKQDSGIALEVGAVGFKVILL